MQLSRKADYALRAMTLLAGLPPGRALSAQELASAGEVPVKFLEQILLVLKRAGLLKSKRGVGGGYQLERASRLISLAEVIEAADGELIRLVEEGEELSFPGSEGLRHHLVRAAGLANEALAKTTLEDLLLHQADAHVGFGI